MGQLKNVILVLLTFFSLSITAQQDVVTFSQEGLHERYRELISELRCPKCQNQNLADSNSMIAEDLRNEVHNLLEQGKTDEEIVEFLVARYGDFVRYRPPFKSTTVLLWVLPGIFLLVIVLVPVVLLRRQRRPADLSLADQDQQRLRELLDKPTKDAE